MSRAFIFAMHERGGGLGSVLPALVDFSGRRRLLDVGGGPGSYSIALVQKTPGLTSPVLDLPASPPHLQFARTPEEWTAAIGRALDAPATPNERRALARPHDWGVLANRMVEEIERRLPR